MNANPNLFTSSASSATAMRQNAEEEEQCVLHDYHDHANDSAETMTSREMLLFTPTGISNIVDNHQGMNGQIPFPLKLHTLLEEVENDPILSSVIAWQPHGRCFIVRKVTEFVNMILQRYVQMSCTQLAAATIHIAQKILTPNRFYSIDIRSRFRQTKFASFQRQLNLYGFKRLTTGRDKGGKIHMTGSVITPVEIAVYSLRSNKHLCKLYFRVLS